MSCSRRKFGSPLLLVLGVILAALPGLLLRGAAAEEKKKDRPGKKEEPAAKEKKDAGAKGEDGAGGVDLRAWGTVKEVKGTPFFTLAYTKLDGRKATKATVFVKAAEDAEFFQDKVIPITDLKEGDAIWVFGRPVEQEVIDTKTGSKGVDMQLQNVLAIATGAGIRVNKKYKDPRDAKAVWTKAEVSKAGPSIMATAEGAEYKVTLGKQAAIVLREKAESKPLKNGAHVEVACEKSDDRPETKSAADAKKESYVARRVALLDRRLVQTLYPMLLE
jgi:hypothetical protein